MREWEAIMIGEHGESLIVSAWGDTLEDAVTMAELSIGDFPGWSVTLTGDVRRDGSCATS